ncbi:hypothetical protein IAT38_008189 [Cryptococcus sp. DSM 104549]
MSSNDRNLVPLAAFEEDDFDYTSSTLYNQHDQINPFTQARAFQAHKQNRQRGGQTDDYYYSTDDGATPRASASGSTGGSCQSCAALSAQVSSLLSQVETLSRENQALRTTLGSLRG